MALRVQQESILTLTAELSTEHCNLVLLKNSDRGLIASFQVGRFGNDDDPCSASCDLQLLDRSIAVHPAEDEK